MDKYTLIIILTAIGFFALAAVLLVPIWRFLDSEEKRAEQWDSDVPEMKRPEPADGESESGANDHQRHEGL